MAACWLMVPSQTQRSAAGGSEDRGGCTSSLADAALFVVAGVITKEKNVPVAQKPGKITQWYLNGPCSDRSSSDARDHEHAGMWKTHITLNNLENVR
ncbi:hypothetical protein DPX16_6155 [Anabarilius grahami]|uniref:Uncharacterized protein n=1 Tax=Anabarilius grahami TaxID=495550 RepID=A0A3N0Z2F1_ANAGA|nr:hypothetical protein DPX16_6155 [Anabarilius grahami]